MRTTQRAFGDCLHKYTIVQAIADGNVLPFRIDYVKTFDDAHTATGKVDGIDADSAWSASRP